MSQIKFLTLSGLSLFKDNIMSIIEDNELVTSTALVDLHNRIDNLDIPIESGDGDNSIQLKNTENNANGCGSAALFGYGNTAGASNAFVGGDSNQAYGKGSVVIGGKNNKIEGTGEYSAIVGGDENLVTGDRAFAFGHNVKVYGQYGASFGYDNTVNGLSGFAEGTRNTVSAHGAHAEGSGTTASGDFSHSEGFETTASGVHSHSEGYQTQAINTDAHAEGHLSISAEHASHAEGTETYAGGWSTHTEGIGTVAYNHNGEHAQGKYNISNTGTIHSIGIGSDNDNRKNAVEIKDDGKHYILGIGGYDGTNIDSAIDVASALNSLTDDSKIWEYSQLKTDLDNQNNITAGFNNTNVVVDNSTESKKSLHMPSSEFGSMNAVGSFMQFGSELWKCQLVAGSRGYDYIRTNNDKKTPEGLYFRKYGEISKGVDGYGWTPWREIVSIDNTGKLCITHLDSEYHYSGGPTSVNNTLTIPYTTNFSNSIKVNNTNVSLEGHTHNITIKDSTDTLESILESFSTSINDNATNLTNHITEFETYKTNHGTGVHVSTAAQSFSGLKTFTGGIKIRKSYYAINNTTSLAPYPTLAGTVSKLQGVGLSFLHTNDTNCLAGLGLLPESSTITDENIYNGLVIDANSSVIIRSRYGLRVGTFYPNGSNPFTNRISFGQDIENAYIDVPGIAEMNIFAGNSLDLSTVNLSLSSDNITVGSSNPTISANSSLTINGNGNLILNNSTTSPIICKSAVQSAYVYDHGTITATTKTINLQSGCLNKIEINANCALTLTLTNPNISSFNEYSAHCIISCGTGVTSTNTITLPAMCSTAQTIQYAKTSIIELDIIAYPESSNGTKINYLCSWQYHRL